MEFTGWTQVGCERVTLDYIVGCETKGFLQVVDQYSARLLEIKENLEKDKRV
jgi:hypothetical protein